MEREYTQHSSLVPYNVRLIVNKINIRLDIKLIKCWIILNKNLAILQ
jgi:hypothetical protein